LFILISFFIRHALSKCENDSYKYSISGAKIQHFFSFPQEALEKDYKKDVTTIVAKPWQVSRWEA